MSDNLLDQQDEPLRKTEEQRPTSSSEEAEATASSQAEESTPAPEERAYSAAIPPASSEASGPFDGERETDPVGPALFVNGQEEPPVSESNALTEEEEPPVVLDEEGQPIVPSGELSQPEQGESEASGSWDYDQYVYEHYEQYRRLTAPLTIQSQPLDTLESQERLASSLQKSQASTIWLLAAFLIITLVLCGVFMLISSASVGY